MAERIVANSRDHSNRYFEAGADPQLSLDFAPPKMQSRLCDAHNRPLAGFKRHGAMVSKRVMPSESWRWPFLEIGQTRTSHCALVFDCDDPNTTELTLHDKAFPQPSWIVQNLGNRHMHIGYGLALPVHRYPSAKQKPLQTLRRVTEYGRHILNADPGFSGVLTRNPAPQNPIPEYGERTETRWGRKRLFGLDELRLFIPPNWRMPPRGKATTGIGRNLDLFCDCMDFAGRQENEGLSVVEFAYGRVEAIIEEYEPVSNHLFPDSEIDGIAASVERYRQQWAKRKGSGGAERGWHSERFIGRQAARGKASGKRRRKKTEVRDAFILVWWRAGHTQQALAQFHGLTKQQVSLILKRDRDLQTPPRLRPIITNRCPIVGRGMHVDPPNPPRPEPVNAVEIEGLDTWPDSLYSPQLGLEGV